jgi:UDP-N-acetylglucosamine 4-epimerase
MILVTGGAGFIGSHLVEALLHQGEKIRILDNLSTGKKENLEEITGSSLPDLRIHSSGPFRVPLGGKIELILGDISDLSTCRLACQGVTHIFHLAALGSVQRSIEDPIRTHTVNVTGTLNLLQAAKEARVKRVLYASSSSIYGNVGENPEEILPKNEKLPPNPHSPYAVSKLAGEYYCRVFSQAYQLETVCLRYFNVFGPRQDPHSVYAAVIPRFIMALMSGKSPVIYGDGHQSRDFTYVDNVVHANLLAYRQEDLRGETMNIACAHRISIQELYRTLIRISGVKADPQSAPPRAGEVRHSLADIHLARQKIGYEVQVEFEEGLRRTWEWFRKRSH